MGSTKLRIALYGKNGHQLQSLIDAPYPRAEVVAICEVAQIPPCISPREEDSLDAILARDDVDLASLRSLEERLGVPDGTVSLDQNHSRPAD